MHERISVVFGAQHVQNSNLTISFLKSTIFKARSRTRSTSMTDYSTDHKVSRLAEIGDELTLSLLPNGLRSFLHWHQSPQGDFLPFECGEEPLPVILEDNTILNTASGKARYKRDPMQNGSSLETLIYCKGQTLEAVPLDVLPVGTKVFVLAIPVR